MSFKLISSCTHEIILRSLWSCDLLPVLCCLVDRDEHLLCYYWTWNVSLLPSYMYRIAGHPYCRELKIEKTLIYWLRNPKQDLNSMDLKDNFTQGSSERKKSS